MVSGLGARVTNYQEHKSYDIRDPWLLLTLSLPLRDNCISPTVLTEAVAYHADFPGFIPVPVADVALAYIRAISNPITGRILNLHKTSS